MSECVFCEIIRGERKPAKYQEHPDAGVVSFEPLNPVTSGHRLFVPVACVPDARTSPDITASVFGSAARWAQYEGAQCNLITSAGELATQTVRHLHVHYVPRGRDDGLRLPWSAQSDHAAGVHQIIVSQLNRYYREGPDANQAAAGDIVDALRATNLLSAAEVS